MRLSFKLGIALAILVLATSAFASTVIFSYTGDGVNVTGTLGGTFSGGVFTATSGSGFYNSIPMTLVNGGGTQGAPDTTFLYDNKVFFPQVNGDNVDLFGLMFNVTGLGYTNLCATTGCNNDSNTGYTDISDFGKLVSTPVEATFSSPTPEPSTLLLFGSSILGLAGLARKRLFS